MATRGQPGRNLAVDQALELESEVRDLVALMEPIVPKGITLELTSSLDGQHVVGDRAQVQQVVMNLILNAAEASRAPDLVRISLEPVVDSKRREWVDLVVADSGVGIPAEEQAHIFDPFFSSKGNGSGLGLASSRKIVRALGGTIQITSEDGRGTRASVWLPATRGTGAPRRPKPPIPMTGGRVVLVVDDEPSVRRVIALQLQQLDYQVVEAGDGPDAIAAYGEYADHIDLVVLDLKMPGMDGRAVLGELRRMRADLPVILCSGYDPAEGPGADDEGLTLSLPKPFRAGDLHRVLARLNERASAGAGGRAESGTPIDPR